MDALLWRMHGVLFTLETAAARAGLRERLEFSCVNAGRGWLHFNESQANYAFYADRVTCSLPSFWCDEIKQNVEELAAESVDFSRPGNQVAFDGNPLIGS